eukprot:SAG11_NODE_2504_length_3274_cov_5.227888_3_plen_84_part_00
MVNRGVSIMELALFNAYSYCRGPLSAGRCIIRAFLTKKKREAVVVLLRATFFELLRARRTTTGYFFRTTTGSSYKVEKNKKVP